LDHYGHVSHLAYMAQKQARAPRVVTSVSVADAKRHLSQLLGRVAYGGETVTITKRGRAVARLVPVEGTFKSWSELGYLENDDPFFALVDEVVARRSQDQVRDPFARRAKSTRTR